MNLDNGFKEGQFFIQTSITSTCGRSVWITGSNASKQAWNRDQADLTSSSTFDGNIYYIKRQLFYKTQIKFRKNIKKVALLKNTFLRSCRSGKANYFECIERNQSQKKNPEFFTSKWNVFWTFSYFLQKESQTVGIFRTAFLMCQINWYIGWRH